MDSNTNKLKLFANDFIYISHSKTLDSFRKKYREKYKKFYMRQNYDKSI